MLEKELLALQEKMRKLVEESNNKKKAKKKIKEKKKPVPAPGLPKANAVAPYGAKANNIGETLGKNSYKKLYLYNASDPVPKSSVVK